MKKTDLSDDGISPVYESPEDVDVSLPPVAARQADVSAATTDLAAWRYERAEGPGIIELVQWTDNGLPPLRMHFHAEIQVTIVLSGARCFLAGGRTFTVRAGQFAVIPAGLPHRANARGGTVGHGVSLYLRQDTSACELTVGLLDPAWIRAGRLDFRLISELILNGACSLVDDCKAHKTTTEALAGSAPFEKLSDIAHRHGLTREAFSRGVARQLGMPPHQYRTVDRLNCGRQRLRTGESVATIATELEFADQSHFTRLFRSTFGTTPGRYRKAFE